MTAATVPALAGETLPAERNPAAVYLSSLAEGPARSTTRSALRTVARLCGGELETMPWHELRFAHVAAIRAKLAATYAPASANRMFSAVRQTIRTAWRLGLLDGEAYQRAVDVPNVRGSRLPAGRSLDGSELRALFAACADGIPAGARDAAAFALIFGCGLRREEAAAVALADVKANSGAIRVIGKGNRERTVYAVNGSAAALAAWAAVRGAEPGPLLNPVDKAGRVHLAPVSAAALRKRLQVRARQAGIAACSPHDLRRSFITSALEGGADVAMVQKLAGHASPATTSLYDRRPEAAKAAAARLVHVPFVAGAGPGQ